MTVAALYVEREELRARFFAKTARDEQTGCLVWTASRNAKGYGQFSIAPSRPALAHRVAWYCEYGEWPEPCALHKCDNPACVEITHLFLGSRADNNRDMEAKGRARYGIAQSSKTVCKHGHPLSGENLRIYNGRRVCRTCAREWTRKKRAACNPQ